jgi:hypothetical protein
LVSKEKVKLVGTPQYSKSIEKKYGKAVATKLSDPSNYTFGRTLRQGDECIAPDGEPCGNYSKGWRFLPVHHSTEVGQMLKKIPKVIEAMDRLHNLSGIPKTYNYQRFWTDVEKMAHQQKVGKHQKIIDDAYHNLVIAPQIKAEKEQKEREEEEQRQTIATLKMRVQELTKRPISQPTAPAVTSSLPIIPIIIIAVIVGFLLLRRRA